MPRLPLLLWVLLGLPLAALLTACAGKAPLAGPAPGGETPPVQAYRIGPGDTVNVFVWRNPEVSATVTVRPDGRISTPLVEDMAAVGKTPTELARDIERELATYIKDPRVTVIVAGFGAQNSAQIRVVGEVARPQALPYREAMTLLDVMIATGGLTEFAAGNRAKLVRVVQGEQRAFTVRLDDLMRGGDISANVPMRPGDILIIPESWL